MWWLTRQHYHKFDANRTLSQNSHRNLRPYVVRFFKTKCCRPESNRPSNKKKYTVILAGAKSLAEVDIADYGFTVIGKPVHTGSLTDSVTDALRNLVLSRDQGTKVGVFGGGQCSTSSDGISKIKQTIPMSSEVAILNALVAKIGNSEDLNTRAQDFVNQLINIKKL